MASPLERMARAMCWERCQEEWELKPHLMCDGAENCIDHKDEIPVARAALQALEEPTPEMVEAGYECVDMGPGPDGGYYCDPPRQWRAMIRRAQED